jgi:hypothetical protein
MSSAADPRTTASETAPARGQVFRERSSSVIRSRRSLASTVQLEN